MLWHLSNSLQIGSTQLSSRAALLGTQQPVCLALTERLCCHYCTPVSAFFSKFPGAPPEVAKLLRSMQLAYGQPKLL